MADRQLCAYICTLYQLKNMHVYLATLYYCIWYKLTVSFVLSEVLFAGSNDEHICTSTACVVLILFCLVMFHTISIALITNLFIICLIVQTKMIKYTYSIHHNLILHSFTIPLNISTINSLLGEKTSSLTSLNATNILNILISVPMLTILWIN